MDWLKNIFKPKKKISDEDEIIIRQGSPVKADESFHAWTSGTIEEMINASKSETNPIDRHYLLQEIVKKSYSKRADEHYKEICIRYCELHLKELNEKLIIPLKSEMGGKLPRISTFQNYATLLTEIGEFDKAIDVCNLALSYGLEDGTKSGFKGRIDRIIKKR